MFIIKSCPSCSRKLRFPIDRGKIKISCTCGFSFTADPDDPELYTDAEFDLKEKSGEKTSKKTGDRHIKGMLIRRILQYKYDLQNFPLLPVKEKIRIAGETLLVLACIGAAAALIYFKGCLSPEDTGTFI